MAKQEQLGEEQRLTFRVTVRRSHGLTAHLVLGGRRLPAAVGDVSAEGLFLKLERGQLPALKVDSMVDIEVVFEGETFALFGLVRSQHDGGYGVFFPARDPRGAPNPRERFGRISAQLQRASLSQRLKVLKLPE